MSDLIAYIENALTETKVEEKLIKSLADLILNPPKGTVCLNEIDSADVFSVNTCALIISVNQLNKLQPAVKPLCDFLLKNENKLSEIDLGKFKHCRDSLPGV